MTATISAKDISVLRQRTGAGITDCKNALITSGGDMDKAVEHLRTTGIAKAEKRAARMASEGRISCILAPDCRVASLLELNSETDFVSRNEEFGAVVQQLGDQLFHDASVEGVEPVASQGAFFKAASGGDSSLTIEDAVKGASAKTGENVVLRRYARFSTDGALGTYLHHNGKVAAIVEVGGSNGEHARTVAKQVAEHLAAGVPSVAIAVSRDQIASDVVDRERRIFEEQSRQSGKPENIIAKMVEGRINKFFAEVALIEQPWVRDESKTIKQLVEEASKQAGATLTVKRFVRFRMGEE